MPLRRWHRHDYHAYFTQCIFTSSLPLIRANIGSHASPHAMPFISLFTMHFCQSLGLARYDSFWILRRRHYFFFRVVANTPVWLPSRKLDIWRHIWLAVVLALRRRCYRHHRLICLRLSLAYHYLAKNARSHVCYSAWFFDKDDENIVYFRIDASTE